MEESHGSQEAFGNGVSGAAQESAGDRELHNNVGIASQDAGAYLNGRRFFPSEFAMYGSSEAGSNQHFQGLSRSGSLYDEQSLTSAFEDMTLGFRTRSDDPPTSHHNVALTNGHHPSGHVDVTLNQQHVPATRQDDSLPLQFSVAHAKQKSDVEHQEQGYGFPANLGKFSRTSELQSLNSNFGVPCHPSTASASPFQQQCYVDEQSQIYRPHDQNVSSNFVWPHGVQPYSVVQPQYLCPQMQQVSGLDVYQHRSNEHAAVCNPANVPSSHIGTPNSHGLENGYPYFNVAAFHQNRNNWLNNTFTDSLPTTSYSSCGSGDFRCCQQAEKYLHPSGQGFSHHQQTDNLAHPYRLGSSHHQTSGRINTGSYPESFLRSNDVGNPNRAIKFAPSANDYVDTDHRINGYGHDHLGIQSNNSMLQLFSSKTEPTIDEVVGRICILAKEQKNFHFLMKILTEGAQEDADKVFYGILDHIGELMVDPVANYLVQNILGSNHRRMHIIYEITKAPAELIKICCNVHGTRVMQKVIETIATTKAASMVVTEVASMVVTALSHGTIRLMTDPNGYHVMNLCLDTLLPEHKAFIIEAAASRYLQLARDRHGCCVLQKCIEHSNDEQRNDLLSKITSSALRLSEDQYGYARSFSILILFLSNLYDTAITMPFA
ncbi:hypothetical protein PVAP13_8KG285400 [Panicum virgatum]|uniref:PUM-HD domain-containing protein n=1 Tax=Panicum virgatum TaxID=38727 RepID=A0A8T0PKH1_PANVG|nr:hypothetical protein PVAP13_8KG285400 [Panicum virgatum]